MSALGLDHPLTAFSLNNLGLLLMNRQEYDSAQPLFEQALAIYEQQLGLDDPATRTIRANLTTCGARERARRLSQWATIWRRR